MAAQVLHIIELQLGLDGLCEENIIFNVPHQLLKHEVTPFVLRWTKDLDVQSYFFSVDYGVFVV